MALVHLQFQGGASIQLQLKPAFEACREMGLTPECFSLQLQHPEDLDLIEHPAICIAGKIYKQPRRETDNPKQWHGLHF